MVIEFQISGDQYTSDLSNPYHISIPVIFNGDQPNIFDVPSASSNAVETENFIADTRLGGSFNFEEINIIPHCNGTHTECIGHITLERISLHDILNETLIPASLITVNPQHAFETNDSYEPLKNEDDKMITLASLKSKLSKKNSGFTDAVIIRTLPNEYSKTSRRYMNDPSPFFSIEAIEYLNSLGVKHLLVDFPSLDRTFDEGKHTIHHIFWGFDKGRNTIKQKTFPLNQSLKWFISETISKTGIIC